MRVVVRRIAANKRLPTNLRYEAVIWAEGAIEVIEDLDKILKRLKEV